MDSLSLQHLEFKLIKKKSTSGKHIPSPADQEVVREDGKNTQMSGLQGSGTEVRGW